MHYSGETPQIYHRFASSLIPLQIGSHLMTPGSSAQKKTYEFFCHAKRLQLGFAQGAVLKSFTWYSQSNCSQATWMVRCANVGVGHIIGKNGALIWERKHHELYCNEKKISGKIQINKNSLQTRSVSILSLHFTHSCWCRGFSTSKKPPPSKSTSTNLNQHQAIINQPQPTSTNLNQPTSNHNSTIPRHWKVITTPVLLLHIPWFKGSTCTGCRFRGSLPWGVWSFFTPHFVDVSWVKNVCVFFCLEVEKEILGLIYVAHIIHFHPFFH